ncbi:CHAT domain-containing protein [Streptomyces xiamenensis]
MVEHLLRHNQLARRAQWLLQRAMKRRSTGKLSAARRAFESVLAAMDPRHPDRPACLSSLSTVLRLQYAWTADPGALDALVEINERIVRSLPEEHPDRQVHGLNLRNVMTDLLARPLPGLLARALPLAREASADPAHRAAFRPVLILCLDEVFRESENEEVLLEIIALGRRQVDSVSADDPDRGMFLGDLGVRLRTLALLRGRPEDLGEAVAVGWRAVRACPSGHERRASCLRALSNSLHALYTQHDRSPATLRESVALGRQAVGAARPGHPERSACLTGLGIALRTTFEESGDLDALREAVRVSREAVAASRPGAPERPAHLNNLSAACQELYKRTGEPEAIREALSAAQEAVELTPAGTSRRANRLSELGNALEIAASGAPGTPAPATPGQDDAAARNTRTSLLKAAVRVAREAAAEGKHSDAGRGGRLSNLSVAARTLFEDTGDPAALEEAVRAARTGVSVSGSDHGSRATCLLSLVRALARLPAEPEVLREMASCCAQLEAAGVTPRKRVLAQRFLGLAAASAGPAWAGTALEAYRKAVAWLPDIAPRRMLRPDREFGLSELAGLPAEAAAAALALGRPQQALLMLEHARGLLLREGMGADDELRELRRTDPAAADEFDRLRSLLNASDRASVDLYQHGHGSRGSVPAEARDGARTVRHQQLAGQWEAVLARIRALPGWEGFLLPPPIASLRRRAAEGPVVLVSPSPLRCDALILTVDGAVRSLRLDCDVTELHALAEAFQRVTGPGTGAAIGAAGADESELLRHLDWLWERIGRPVLAELGMLSSARCPEAELPRLWWCPIGVAAFLPLHAAGRYGTADEDTGAAVMDHVVSSYTSTVHALRPAGRGGETGTGSMPLGSRRRLLVVEVSRAPGARELPGARFEARRLAEIVPGATSLSGPEATREAVFKTLPEHGMTHFACHATTDPRSPSLSHLLLHDHASAPVTAIDLSALSVPAGELAFLSACETARSSQRLADEAVHIATAFQLVGYRHVIGTLWRVADSAAGRIADDFYTALPASLDPGHAARCLHRAVRSLRRDAPHRPSRWAAHIHLGG